jgi:hypothetical protein
MEKSITKEFNTILFFVYLTFGFVISLLYFRYINSIDFGIFLTQIVSSFIFILLFYVGSKYDKNGIMIIIILYQLVLTLSLYYYFVYYVGNPLGYVDPGNDSVQYQKIIENTQNIPLNKFIDYLITDGMGRDISNWGFPLYRFLINRISPDIKYSLFITGLVNVCLHTISCHYLYKLSLHVLDKQSAKIVLLLWGLSVLSIYYNAAGVKNTVFVFLCILAVYHLYTFYEKRKITNFVMMCVFITAIWFFRYFVSLFIILTFIGCVLFKKTFNKLFVFVIITMFLLTLLGLKILAVFLPILLNKSDIISSKIGMGTAGYLITIFLAFITSIPTIINIHTQNDGFANLLIIAYSIMKVYFSFFSIYGIYYAMKTRDVKMYPLIMIAVFNTLLLIVAALPLDNKFDYPISFIKILLSVYGYNIILQKKLYFCKKKLVSIKLIYAFIMMSSVMLTVFYNFRPAR